MLTLFSVVKLLMTAQILLDMYNQHKVYLGEKQRAFVVSSYLNSKIPYDPDLWVAVVRYVEGMLEVATVGVLVGTAAVGFDLLRMRTRKQKTG